MMTMTRAIILLGVLFGGLIVAGIVTHRRLKLQLHILRFLKEHGGITSEFEVLKGFIVNDPGLALFSRGVKELHRLEKLGCVSQFFGRGGVSHWKLTQKGYNTLQVYERS